MRNPFHTDPRRCHARSIERLLDDASRPTPLGMLRFPRIYRREVVLSCAEPLTEIAAVLRDDERLVTDDVLERIVVFLTDGCTSPLLREHAGRARLAACELAAAVACAPRRPAPAALRPALA
jgi:hypothetical protein